MFKDAVRVYGLLDDFSRQPHPDATPRLLGLVDDVGEEARDVLGQLAQAQIYRLDTGSFSLLDRMLTDLGPAAVSMFEQTPLPFPTIWVEADYLGRETGTLITPSRNATVTQARSFVQWDDGLMPPMHVVEFRGSKAFSAPTMSLLMMQEADTSTTRRKMEDERARQQVIISSRMTAMMKASSILLRHPGMFEVSEEIETYSRPERRRAEREGRKLPEIRRISLKLGAFGRGHASAMGPQEGPDPGLCEKMRRRAHWVRGHFMQTRSGEVTWRMPHMRGIGPLVAQERRITSTPEIEPGP